MFITKKKHEQEIKEFKYDLSRNVGWLKDENIMLRNQVRALQIDVQAILEFLKAKTITIPTKYKVVPIKESPETCEVSL